MSEGDRADDGAKARPLALTCGDPAGIGPEVLAGALERERDVADLRVIGPPAWVEAMRGRFGVEGLAVGDAGFEAAPGEPSEGGAALAAEALEEAAAGCAEGRYGGVVSAPVSKLWMRRAGFRWPGQTEFFAERWAGTPVMAFVGERLRVVLATWHIPLREVPEAVTAEALERAVRRAHELARRLGAERPRIGVCGLNPHAGEGGLLGRDEAERLDPALDRVRRDIPGVSPCLPGDTVFHRNARGEFDACVALYHDQGLAAVKTLEFDAAVNLTLGLAHVRGSPDHGTAFEIAGTGRANPGSFSAAVDVVRRFVGRR